MIPNSEIIREGLDTLMTLEWEQAARWKTLHLRSCRWLDDVSAVLGPEAEGAAETV
jgi:hypothetical protein